jgi:hypothetical protein
VVALVNVHERLKRFVPVELKADLSRLSDSERKMLPLLEQAASAMEWPFWIQNYGNPEPLLAAIPVEAVRRYVRMNYGPWDRLYQDGPILSGAGSRPAGANFYPADMTREEFTTAAAQTPGLKSPFTMVRRGAVDHLVAIPYHIFFQEHVRLAAEKLRQAAKLAESSDLQNFLNLRAEALLTDDYHASDLAWMELQDNTLDILIGPMEIEDRLLGIKTAYAASLLIKDWQSGSSLVQFAEMLPRLQASLPVPAAYRRQEPGLESDLNVYEVVHFAGNDAFAKPSGVAWPDDEEIQLSKGTRSLLLRNVIQAKFEALLMPLAELMIASDQRTYVTPEADFSFIMFHELAHGLGVKHTLSDGRLVREALGELHHAVEEGKADLVGLFIATQLHHWGLLSEPKLRDLYVTALVRLLYNYDGVQSVARLNYFKERGAYSRDANTGTYRVHTERIQPAVEALSERLLRFQGDGDYQGAQTFLARYGQPDEDLVHDIKRMETAKLPLGLLLEGGEPGRNGF